MSAELEEQDSGPPDSTLDEGYWSALLNEGEFSHSTHTPENRRITGDPPSDYHTHPGTISYTPETAADWEKICQITEKDEVTQCQVVGCNRGGLLVEWHTLRGFVPASQLIDFPATASSVIRRRAMSDRIGQSLQLRVIELSAENNRLILSERAALVAPGERASILTQLKPGDIVTGQITNLCDFGAFVDLGGLEGLIHISELSWGRVAHPGDMLVREQEIEAYVLDVDRETARIALSLKRLRPDPWKTVQERYQIGEIVEGIITSVVDFGAFACIEEGLEGLVHVSELAEGHFLHPRNVVTEGESIRARILSIDGNARRLGLSLRLGQ